MRAAPPVLVVGAGPTGLSAAYHLGVDAEIVERNPTVGGWCRSVVEAGFTFDYAGHIMFSNDPYVHELYRLLLGDNVHWQDREAWIWSQGVYTRYPFQGALYGLPQEVIRECLLGAIEARYGTVAADALQARGAVTSNGNGNEHHPNGNGNSACAAAPIEDCCADGILEASAPLSALTLAAPENFAAFIHRVWGAGIAKHFAIPYNRKLWKVPLDTMETSWLGGRVPMPDLAEMLDGALSPAPKPMGPNARFGYPLVGGFQALVDGFVPHLARPPRLQTSITRLDVGSHLAGLSDGTNFEYDSLVSTMPLPQLVRLVGAQAPPRIRAAAEGLRHVSVRCVHIGVGREDLTDKHWIYYPEDTVFHRIFVQGNASPRCNPPGGFGLTFEITYNDAHPLPDDGLPLIRRCIAEAQKVGMLRADDPIRTATQTDLPYAYVIYDVGRAERVAEIRDWLLERDVHLAGRYSEWEYYNSDHAFLAGRRVAEEVQAGMTSSLSEKTSGA